MPGTKQIFQTDPQKPLIGSLSRVVEHRHKGTKLTIDVFQIIVDFTERKGHMVLCSIK